MKYIVLAIISFVWLRETYAQSYTPFPTGGAQWTQYESWEVNIGVTQHACGTYYMNDDTTLNGHLYSKIFQTNCLVAFLREDSLRNIYAVGQGGVLSSVQNCSDDTSQPAEFLLYKFSSINVGDTIQLPRTVFFTTDTVYVIVLHIDSILVGNSYRKVYAMQHQNLSGTDYWIEGIGSSKGLFSFLFGSEFENYYETSFYSDSTLQDFPVAYSVYGFENNTCLTAIENEEKSISNIKTYPNPATNQLLISTEGFQPQAITIYNLNGQQLINLPFAREVDISILPPGIYFVEVTGAQGMEVRKLVKM